MKVSRYVPEYKLAEELTEASEELGISMNVSYNSGNNHGLLACGLVLIHMPSLTSNEPMQFVTQLVPANFVSAKLCSKFAR